MANWYDDIPAAGGEKWWESVPTGGDAFANAKPAAPQNEGIVAQVRRRVGEAGDRSLISNLLTIPQISTEIAQNTIRGAESGLYGLGGAATFLGGIPLGRLADVVTGDRFQLADAASGLTERYFDAADRAMEAGPNVGNLENQAAAATGRVGVDLLSALLTGGAAGEAQAVARPVVQQSIGQIAREAAEQAIASGARASIAPSLVRGSQLSTDVLDAGGTLAEAAGAGATGAAANTAAYMLPGAATGSLPARLLAGAGIEVPGGFLQQQAENLALPDRLGLDQAYTPRDALMDALLGGGLAGITGAPGGPEFADPDAMRGRQSIEFDADRGAAWFDDIPTDPPDRSEPAFVEVPEPRETIIVPPEPASPPAAPVAEPVPTAAEAPARSAGPIERTDGRLEVEADTRGGPIRLVDEPAPAGADFSEFGQVRVVEAFDGDTKIGELLYANDGTPPTVNVEPEYQRRGVATAMYALAEQQGGVLGGREGVRGRGAEYRTPAGAAFRSAMDTSGVALRPAAAVASEPAPPPPVTPQTEAPASPPAEAVAPSPWARPGTPEFEAAQAQPTPPPPTSTKNRVTEAERTAEGRDPIVREMRRSNEETVSRAREALAENPRLVDEIVARDPSAPISSTEEAAMLLQKVQERNRREEASRVLADPNASESARAAARRAWDDAEAKIGEIDAANIARGREWGRLGQFRQRLMAADFSLEAMESKLRRAKGAPLTAEETAGLRELADRLSKAELDLADARRQIAEFEQNQIVRSTIEQAIREAMGQVRADKKAGKPKLEALRERAEAARKSLAATESVPSRRAQSGAVISPAVFVDLYHIGAYHVANGAVKLADWVKAMTADLGEKFTALERYWPEIFAAAKAENAAYDTAGRRQPRTTEQVVASIDPANVTRDDVRDLAMARIRAGERDADAIMRAVTADVQSVAPEATEADVRQLFADYGKRASPTRDEDRRTLAALRTIIGLQNEIGRLEGGGERRASGQRRPASDEVRQLRARLKELLKRTEAVAPKEVAAVIRQVRAETLQKQLADLEAQLEGQYRPVRPEKRLSPAEITALREKLAWTRGRIRSIDKELNDAAAAPAREAAAQRQREADRLNQLDGLKAEAEEIQRQIDMGYRTVPRPAKVPDAEIVAARAEVQKLRDQRRAMDSADKRADGLKKRIADLEDMIATGRRPAARGKRAEPSPEIAAMEARRDELIREMRSIDRPRVDPETRYQRTRARTLASEAERIRERMATGDYARRPRVPKALSEANKAAAFELDKLRREFRLKQFQEELKQRSRVSRYLDNTASGINLARAVMTSFDLSGLLRQGGFITLGHPVRGATGIPDMLKAFVSERAAHAVQEDIENRPNAPLYKKAGLQITSDDGSLSKMEEAYMTRWLERMQYQDGQPVRNAGRRAFNVASAPIRGSARAYTTFLNKLRADSFDAMAASLSMTGEPADVEAKAIANYINVATGRGSVPGMSDAAAAGLNTIFFAPKLVASRFQLLAGQPLYGGSNRTRAMIAKDYARYMAGLGVVYALGNLARLARDPEDEDERRPFIELDPRSSSFGRMRFGDWFVDPLSGLAQVSTILARSVGGETKTAKGEIKPMRDNYRLSNGLYEIGDTLDRAGFEGLAGAFPEQQNYEKLGIADQKVSDAIGSFVRTKLAPVPGAVVNTLTAENMIGQPTTPGQEAVGLVTPMTFGNVADAMRDQGVAAGTALTLAEILGMGVQFRDRATFDAPDYANLTFDQKRDHSAYLQRVQNMQQDVEELRRLARSFPDDVPPGDVRDAVQAAAESMGLEGVDLAQYKRRTTAKDERGVRRQGLKRTPTGNVEMEFEDGGNVRLMLDTEKAVNAINKQIEDMIRAPMTDEELDKVYQKYYPGASADGDKMVVARALADERERAVRAFMEGAE